MYIFLWDIWQCCINKNVSSSTIFLNTAFLFRFQRINPVGSGSTPGSEQVSEPALEPRPVAEAGGNEGDDVNLEDNEGVDDDERLESISLSVTRHALE